MATIVTGEELRKSAQTYQKQLIQAPLIGAGATLQHMTPVPGVHGSHVFTEISGDFQIGPYKRSRWNDGAVALNPRVLNVYLGNTALNFDPNELYGSIYGDEIFSNPGLKNVNIASDMLFYMASKLGKNLNMALWNAKRNESGDAYKDLFNGFDTITDTEKAATKIAEEKGNYKKFGASITSENAYDALQELYEACSDELQGQDVNIYLPFDVYRAYLKDVKSMGNYNYNQTYEQNILEGSNGMAHLVPLASKKGSKYIHISPKSNMAYGFGNGSEKEEIKIGEYKPFEFTFAATQEFGVQFKSIEKEFLMVGELAE